MFGFVQGYSVAAKQSSEADEMHRSNQGNVSVIKSFRNIQPSAKRTIRPRSPDLEAFDGSLTLTDRIYQAVPNSRKVMEYVQLAITEFDPEMALSNHLQDMQTAQQARFAKLPISAREDEWVLLMHQKILCVNQMTHDAALRIVKMLCEFADDTDVPAFSARPVHL